MRLCHWEWRCASYASLSASLQSLGKIDFSRVESLDLQTLYILALFRGDLEAGICAGFGDCFGPKAVSSFALRAIYRGMESCVVSECDSWKEVLHVFVLRVVMFGEASVEMLHEAFYHCIGSLVVRSSGDLLDPKISIHRRDDTLNEFGCFVVAK